MRRRIRKTIAQSILGKLANAGGEALDALFPVQGARRYRHVLAAFDTYPRCVSRRTFVVLLSRLKREGLIAKFGKGSHARWRLTERGKREVTAIQKRVLPPRRDGIGRLVIFDIPESERKKRRSLRIELMAANFVQLQKSVWIGYNPLPEDFLTFLDMLRVRKHVHIFSVRDSGTLV